MSSPSSSPAPAAAAEPASVAAKKAHRRRARGTVKPRLWHVYVDDMLKRSPKLKAVQSVNTQASAFLSASGRLLLDVLIRRTNAARVHCGRSTFQPKDVATAARSFFHYASQDARDRLDAILAKAQEAQEAVSASRAVAE